MRCWQSTCQVEVDDTVAACPACGALLRVGDRHRIVGHCGEGGMGVVYEAIDESLDRTVALKLLRGRLASKPAQRQRFERECRAMAALEHPGIARIYATDVHHEQLYFTQQFVRGEPLHAFVAAKGGRLSIADAYTVGIRLLAALAHAHQRGIVHRDVNPNNILMTQDEDGGWQPMLIDFGLARLVDQEVTKVAWGGTPGFAAPEQLLDPESNDARSDVYAVGAVLYGALSGAVPYGDALYTGIGSEPRALLKAYGTIAQGKTELARLRSVNEDVSTLLDDVIARALSPDPGDRYDTADEMRVALEALAADERTDADPDEGEPKLAGASAPPHELEPAGESSAADANTSTPSEPPGSRVAEQSVDSHWRRWLVLSLVGAVVAVVIGIRASQGPSSGTTGPDAAAGSAASGTIRSDAGDAAADADGSAGGRLLPLLFPCGMAIGPKGTIYIADRGIHRIQALRGDQVTTVAGNTHFGFADGPAAAAQFASPHGVAVTADGTVFVADTANHRIRTLAAGQVRTLAGTFDAGARDGPVATATFRGPESVAVATDGAVYVADTGNHRIRMIQRGEVSTVAGGPEPGRAAGPAAQTRFRFPSAVVVGPDGRVFVLDAGNERIVALHEGVAQVVAAFAALGGERRAVDAGPSGARLCEHPSIAVGSEGQLYVSDPAGHRIWRVAEDELEPFAGTGAPGNNDGYAPKAQFQLPHGLAVAPQDGAVFVTDALSGALRVIREGQVHTLARSPTGGFADGPAMQAQFHLPWGLAVAPDGGTVLVADWVNQRIRAVSGGKVTTLAGTREHGFHDGLAENALFASPWDVAVSPTGEVVVADGLHHRIRGVAAGKVRTIAGTGKPGDGDGRSDAATFRAPAGVDVDDAGNIFVADTGNHRIRVIETSGRVRTLAGGAAGLVNGDAGKARFDKPSSVVLGPDGTVYVADTGNHCIRRLKADRVYTLAGTGEPGFADGQEHEARFDAPVGVAVGPHGEVYVADAGNQRIRMIKDGIVTTLAGSGVPGFRNGPALMGTFAWPADLVVRNDGALIVADSGNQLLRIIVDGRIDTFAGREP